MNQSFETETDIETQEDIQLTEDCNMRNNEESEVDRQGFGPGPGFGPGFGPGPGHGFAPGFGPGPGHGFGYVPPFSIYQCLFRYTYIFPYRGRPFLAFIHHVGPFFISGFRLDHRFGLVPFEMSIRHIAHFSCHYWD